MVGECTVELLRLKDDKAKQAIILMETDPGAVINGHVPTSSNKR